MSATAVDGATDARHGDGIISPGELARCMCDNVYPVYDIISLLMALKCY